MKKTNQQQQSSQQNYIKFLNALIVYHIVLTLLKMYDYQSIFQYNSYHLKEGGMTAIFFSGF